MDQSKVIEKIKKCLALSQSANQNEAAAALRQAQKLMTKYKLTELELELSSVSHAEAKVGSTLKQPMYAHGLVGIIEKAFGVTGFFSVVRTTSGYKSIAKFVGVQPQPEIATYAFEVLFRQLKADRAEYMGTLRRYKKANKTRKADLFAEAWIIAVHSKVSDFAANEKEQELVRSYMEKNYPSLEKSDVKKHKAKQEDYSAQNAGYTKGREANIHTATGFDKRPALSSAR